MKEKDKCKDVEGFSAMFKDVTFKLWIVVCGDDNKEKVEIDVALIILDVVEINGSSEVYSW